MITLTTVLERHKQLQLKLQKFMATINNTTLKV